MSHTTLKINLLSTDVESDLIVKQEVVRAKVLDGTIGAISLDTCIFTDAGYRLESGILKPLEQFKNSTFFLVFSEITIREVHRHMSLQAEVDKTGLIAALRRTGKSWLLTPDRQSEISESLFGTSSGKTIAAKRIMDFSSRCGVINVKAQSALDVDALVKSYFQSKAPFESAGDKKAEFPDAIALLSLEGWAKKANTSVLFVTRDKGCQRFCQDSEFLFSIDNLDDALALIQERQEIQTRDLCRKIEEQFLQAAGAGFIQQVRDAVQDQIWDIDWTVEAESAESYDPELQEIDVVSVSSPVSIGAMKMRVVEFTGYVLVVQAVFYIDIEATCSFSFSVKDGIDHDMVRIGDSSETTETAISVEVLLSFELDDSATPSLVVVELMSSRQVIDFGFVEPDFSDEDPNEEGY